MSGQDWEALGVRGERRGSEPAVQRWVIEGERVGQGRGRAAEGFSRRLHHVREGRRAVGAGLSHHKGCYRSAERLSGTPSPRLQRADRLIGFCDSLCQLAIGVATLLPQPLPQSLPQLAADLEPAQLRSARTRRGRVRTDVTGPTTLILSHVPQGMCCKLLTTFRRRAGAGATAVGLEPWLRA